MAQPINAHYAPELYVSPAGNDQWSGRLPAPNADQTDGPFATVERAFVVLRQLKATGRLQGPVTLRLRAGRYQLQKPIVLTPADSLPLTITHYPGEEAILDGGKQITDWQVAEVNGQTAWVAELPDVATGDWYFRQLWVNGERRERTRLPKQGLVRIAEVPGMPLPQRWGFGGYNQLRLEPGVFGPDWRNISDIELVAFHFWIDERMPVASFDPDTELITTSRESRAPLVESFGSLLAPLYLENVFEALTEPGEWYLDRAAGKLYYLPREGETPETAEVFAPRLKQLLRLEGDYEAKQFVEWITFRGIAFEHTDWVQPGDEDDPVGSANASLRRYFRGNSASAAQGVVDLPGVVSFQGARNCRLEDCRLAHLGWYAIDVGNGCQALRFVGNEIRDLGGGGIKINGTAIDEDPRGWTGNIVVTDNRISQAGRVFHAAIGVISMHSYANTISHNHIHDLYYSGISCGWVWGYRAHLSRDNHIENNHIHDLGQGLLSDMGGIYTLGVQPGTVLRGNLIHDVTKLNYGAWCIYPDEGSSHLLIEHNVCYDTNGEIFHQHYGRENTVRNNIFAFGGDSIGAHGRADLEHKAFSYERNIFLSDGRPMHKSGYRAPLAARNHRSDLNLFWDLSGAEPTFQDQGELVSLADWQALGHDRHSLVADPKFADVAARDFSLAPDSPAITELGFEPIDLTDVGPRPHDKRD